MKKIVPFFCILLLSGCGWFTDQIVGSGNSVKEEREVPSFDELKVAGMMHVQLIPDEKEYVTIEADENLIPYIKSEVQNGELTIYTTDSQIKPSRPITVSVYYKNIIEIDITGMVTLQANKLKSKKLDIAASGASRVTAQIDTDRLEIEGYGSSKFNLTGKARRQKMQLAGATAYNAGGLKSDEVEIMGSGSIHATLNVSKKITGELAGASLVSYKGNPQVNVKATGASSIQKVD